MKSKFVFPFLVIALLASGCGRDRAGDYKGSEIVQQSASAVTTQTGGTQQTAQSYAQSYQVVLKINEGSNDAINGTYQSSAGTGTITGTISEDGNQIQNVVLNMPQPSSSSTGCGGTFTGSLNINDTTISGSLSLSGVSAPTTTGSTTTTSYCSGMTRSFTLTK
jgi:hypothetical protein